MNIGWFLTLLFKNINVVLFWDCILVMIACWSQILQYYFVILYSKNKFKNLLQRILLVLLAIVVFYFIAAMLVHHWKLLSMILMILLCTTVMTCKVCNPVYTVSFSKKTTPLIFGNNLGKWRPIYKILSLNFLCSCDGENVKFEKSVIAKQ